MALTLQRGQHRRRHRERGARRARRRSTATAPAGPRRSRRATGVEEPSGSNGFAIAPSNTVNHRALLLINPHTSFFFRSELQMTSDEGLDAYGAATWGQFFIYQGFNDRLGWMHTSTGADAVDEYAETVVRTGRPALLPVRPRRTAARDAAGSPSPTGPPAGMATRTFTVYRTHHGPIVRAAERQVDQRPADGEAGRGAEPVVPADQGADARAVRKVMELHANSSNNTVYADADGHIAYFHPQFVPRRDDRFDWTRPVDGSDPATEWHGVHGVEDSPHVIDPPNGWIQNTNDWPYSAAGPYSPSGRISRRTWTRPARARAGCTRSGCWRVGRTSRPSGSATRHSTAISRRSRGSCRRCWRRTIRAPGGDSLKAQARRADRGAPGVGLPVVGGLACRRRSRCTGAIR